MTGLVSGIYIVFAWNSLYAFYLLHIGNQSTSCRQL